MLFHLFHLSFNRQLFWFLMVSLILLDRLQKRLSYMVHYLVGTTDSDLVFLLSLAPSFSFALSLLTIAYFQVLPVSSLWLDL